MATDNEIPNIESRLSLVATDSGGLFVRSKCDPKAFELNTGDKQIISYQDRDSFYAMSGRYGFRPYVLGLADVTLAAPGALALGAANFTLPTQAAFFAIEVGNTVTIEDTLPISAVTVNANPYSLGPAGTIPAAPLDYRVAYKPRLLVFNVTLNTSGNTILITSAGAAAGRYFSNIHIFSAK